MIILFDFLLELVKNLFCFTGAYSNSIFPEPLSKDEEDKYIKLAKLGDIDARNKLVEHNLRLVAHIVKKFDATNHNIDDLIGIGTIGLIKGIDTYSLKHNVRITTYCAKCIENEILMYFRADKKNSKNVSINEGIGFDKEGNEITILDVLRTPSVDPLDEIHKNDNIKLLEKYMGILTNREKEILKWRYGLENNDEITQKEIAKKLGISRSYVSRIEKRATTKILREFIKNKKTI
ncbi:MAG: RNA polymerase sporulation sigma factor SigK [bacterium]|nr:RNA polymerase sporulation sigma factor SigK [bacterium]